MNLFWKTVEVSTERSRRELTAESSRGWVRARIVKKPPFSAVHMAQLLRARRHDGTRFDVTNFDGAGHRISERRSRMFPATSALLTASIPVLLNLARRALKQAEGEGAPADPRSSGVPGSAALDPGGASSVTPEAAEE